MLIASILSFAFGQFLVSFGRRLVDLSEGNVTSEEILIDTDPKKEPSAWIRLVAREIDEHNFFEHPRMN